MHEGTGNRQLRASERAAPEIVAATGVSRASVFRVLAATDPHVA